MSRRSSTLTRLGIAALAATLIAGVASGFQAANATHGPNGAMTTGPDLVMVDCVRTNQTTADPEPQTSATTGSGCRVQAQTNTPYPVTARYTENGQPVGNRRINFTISAETTSSGTAATATTQDAFFPNSSTAGHQPAGTTTTTGSTPRTAACFTDAQGECTVNVRKPTEGTATVTATEQESQQSASEVVEFRSNTGFARFIETDRRVVKPENDDYTGTECRTRGTGSSAINPGTGPNAGTDCTTPGSNTSNDSETVVSGTPGRPVQVTYQLRDSGSSDPAQPGPRPLSNRQVTLTVSSNFFFTPNCGPVTFSGSNTTPNTNSGTNPAPDYRACAFTPAPQDGARVGFLVNLGPTLAVRSDNNGLITVTVAVAVHSGFNDDGRADAIVSASGLQGSTSSETVTQPFLLTPGSRTTTDTPAPLFFNTRNRPLNGELVEIIPVDGNNAQTGPTLGAGNDQTQPGGAVPGSSTATTAPSSSGLRINRTFRPISASFTSSTNQRFMIFLRDQFENLVKVPETDVSVAVTQGSGQLRRECVTSGTPTQTDPAPSGCTNPAAQNTNFSAPQPVTSPPSTAANNQSGTTFARSTRQDRSTGSYTLPSEQDRFSLTTTTPTTVEVTWQAPRTTFASGAASPSPTGTATTTPTGTASPGPTTTTTTTASPGPTQTVTASPSPTRTVTVTPTGSPTPVRPTINVFPSTIVVQQAARVFGTARPGATIEIWAREFGVPFRRVRQATVGSSAQYEFFIVPPKTVRVFARSDGLDSGSLIVSVRARVSSTAQALPGCVVRVSGSTSPVKPGQLVDIYYTNSTGGRTLAMQARTDSTGRYLVQRRFSACGRRIHFFSRVRADNHNLEAQSAGNAVLIRR